MDSTTIEIPEKFELVINGLLNHEYAVTNDVYLEMLISHLSGKHGEGKLNSEYLIMCMFFFLKYSYCYM